MERRLSAILAADVVGYSAQMEVDEEGTFARLTARRKELFGPEIKRHHGRIFKLMGDGLLAEFVSVVDAVECAVTLQRGMAERNASLTDDKRIEVRVGINLGEVIVEGEDRYGKGVNVAARLQEVADPGGIFVSSKVSKEVEKKLAFVFEPVGEQRLKNIAEPIACFRVSLHPRSIAPQPPTWSTRSKVPTKASIAILPFNNMSSDQEQEYFVDGLVEDLITNLSKVSWLFVISRNSAFSYKGKLVDVRVVARDLGVRYVVEGSVRRAASRIRINVQLIDAGDGTHLWADRFDRNLADVFELQDEVVAKIVGALSGALPAPVLRPSRKATNVESYDYFVRGRSLVNQSVQNKTARLLLEKALELDPSFAEAYAWLAVTHQLGSLYCGEPVEEHKALSRQAAEKAVSLDSENTEAHLVLGYLRAYEDELMQG